MKKMFLSVLSVCAFSAHAAELATFDDVVTAVGEGKQITFVMNLNECSSEKPMPTTVMASVKPNAVVVVGNSRITASDRHFTMDSPTAPGTPIFDFSKYTINSEGDASLKMTVMNAISYEKLAGFQVNCKLGKGFKVFG